MLSELLRASFCGCTLQMRSRLKYSPVSHHPMELFSLYFYTFLQADLVEITPSDSGMSCQSRCLSLPSQSARQKTPHFMFICSCSNKAWKQMKDNCSLKISPFTCDVKGEVLTGGSGRLRVAASEEEETSTSSSHTSRSATEVPQLQRQKENRKVWRRFKKHSSFSGFKAVCWSDKMHLNSTPFRCTLALS